MLQRPFTSLGSCPSTDALGDKITDWIISKDLHMLNNGSTTRTCQITVNYSTPDLSLCGCNWSTKTSWTLAEPIGNSDYLPITIIINHIIRYQSVTPRKARWLRNGIDWPSFTNEVELEIQQLPKESNILIRISWFNNILISSASLHVSKTKPSKKL